MLKEYKTIPEAHWSGEAGDEWFDRCFVSDKLYASRLSMYSSILRNASGIRSVLEYGAGSGQSLFAVKTLLPDASFGAVEINAKAVEALRVKFPECEVFHGSVIDIDIPKKYDFVFTNGLLLHITEEFLPGVYDKIYNSSNRYISVSEYYNPTPVTVNYRGNTDIMFKRDFAGELLDRYPNLSLVDYGFVYHRDHNFSADDFNWFLLEKR